MNTPQAKKKMIIDTDAGFDDTFAVSMALLHPDWEVVAITCVAGNVNVDNAARNIAKILITHNQTHIPIYKGAHSFITQQWGPDHNWEGHGKDGLGGVGPTEQLLPLQPEHAAQGLIKWMDTDTHLICLGPLTNVALAILMDPTFVNRFTQTNFTIMGASHLGMGNTTYSAEFNVHCDPEAAHICLSRLPKTRIISYELSCDTALPWEFHDTVLQPCSNPYVTFLHSILQHYIKKFRGVRPELVVCDMCAMAAVLAPHLIKEMHGHVELSGAHTRGTTVFDWRNRTDVTNTNVILEMDKSGYQKFSEDIFLLRKLSH